MVDNHFSGDQIEDNCPPNDDMKDSMDQNEGKRQTNSRNNNKKYFLRCHVCSCDKSIFFCSDCIKNGDFTYSKERIPERFAEKKLKYFKLKSDQNIISDKIETLLNNCFIKDEIVFKNNYF